MTRAVVGTTSYGFRYLLADGRHAPSLAGIVERTSAAGLDALQICENARPLAASVAEWRGTIARANDLGLELHLGCMTLDTETLSQYLERAAMIPGASALRIVLEDDSGEAPGADRIDRFLESAARLAAAARLTLAIENHFHIPCRVLADACRSYPRELIAFCVDSANSLRNWESADSVFDVLGDRALYYHLKDYRVHGSNVGFQVMGAPLGAGDLDVGACVERMFVRHRRPLIFLENWVPHTGDRDADVAADAEWLARSAAALRELLATDPVVR
jgi:sugar phosphate isomerase/epimerase